VDVSLSTIPGAFHLPRPDWDAIRGWVEKHVADSERSQIWATLAVQWLDILNEALGGSYRIEKGDRILLFAPRDYVESETLLDAAESALRLIVDILGNVAATSWEGPLVLLLFADAETFCRYVSPFDQERAYFRAGAVCFKKEYIHVVLRPYPLDTLRSNIYHEITHACFCHLELPLWLEEGITQLIEVEGNSHHIQFHLDGKIAGEMRKYWQEHGLRDFWWGGGFWADDEGQGHCYSLAEVLFRLLLTDYRKLLPSFIRHAHAADAGDSAAQEFLGKRVEAIAKEFLGPGSWAPVPPDGPSWCRRGMLYLSRQQYDLAMRDFEEAILCDPRLASAYTNRGLVHYQLRQTTKAIADFEKAIDLDPIDFVPHNNLAWILATSSEENYRDGARALKHANKACELVQFTEWYCVGTLAAAHAEVEEFEESRRYAKEALRLAPPEEQTECKERLKLYWERKSYREESPSTVGVVAKGLPSSVPPAASRRFLKMRFE